MTFLVYHRYGASERDPPLSIFPVLLDELEERLEDEEHTSVSVIHESEWGLGLHRGGYITYENVEEGGDPRHMRGIPREKAIELMVALARGELAALEREPWLQGYWGGHPGVSRGPSTAVSESATAHPTPSIWVPAYAGMTK